MGGKELKPASPDNSFKKSESKLRKHGAQMEGEVRRKEGFGCVFFLKLGEIMEYLSADRTDQKTVFSNV